MIAILVWVYKSFWNTVCIYGHVNHASCCCWCCCDILLAYFKKHQLPIAKDHKNAINDRYTSFVRARLKETVDDT